MNRKLSIACLQYSSEKNEKHTLETIRDLIYKALDVEAELITLPECSTSLQKNSFLTNELAKTEDENFSLQILKEIAKLNSIFILIGSLPIKVDDKLVNISFLVGPKGDILYKYDKIHLYDVNLPNGDVYRESNTYKSGNKAIIAEIKKNKIKIGLTICYDLRFPHLYQDLAVNGAEIIVVPSAFSNLTGPVHWHTLLKARAIETGAFIIAPAQTGYHECGRTSYGHSLIVSPWGEVLKDAKEEIGVIHANINLDEVMKARRAIPALNSKKDYLTNF
jgi:predicted amidohydrolase